MSVSERASWRDGFERGLSEGHLRQREADAARIGRSEDIILSLLEQASGSDFGTIASFLAERLATMIREGA